MAKKNLINEICDAITEIKKILASPGVKNELLIKTLENRELELLHDLHEAIEKRASRPSRNQIKKGD